MVRRSVAAAVGVVATTLATGPLAGPPAAQAAAPGQAGSGSTAPYVVVLDEEVASPRAVAHRHARDLGVDVDAVYARAAHAYLAELTGDEADRLRARDEVAVVERDRDLHIAQASPTVPVGVRRIGTLHSAVADVDSQDDAPVDADVAVLDTGVSPHPDLNLVSQVDCSQGWCVSGGGDVYGHGTHVAGIVGAVDDGRGVVGVAPGVRIHSVRVCGADGACSLSALVAGIDHVASAANVVEVANLSLGAPGNARALDAAISRAVDAGVVLTVAAGNETTDAAQISPANHPDVVAVSAMADTDGRSGGAGGPAGCLPRPNADDTRLFFSNFGPVVDVTAPGACVVSTGMDGGYAEASGTSMAAPHAAGAAALLAAGSGDPSDRASALAIAQRLVQGGRSTWYDDSGDGVQEPLLDVASLSGGTPGASGSSPSSPSSAAPPPGTEATSAPATSPTGGAGTGTGAGGDDLTRATSEWVYYHTPDSVDWDESSCVAWAVINLAGPDLVASAGGDLTRVYPHTSTTTDAAISSLLPRCVDRRSLEDLHAAGWPW
jgi:subtilisin